MERQRNREQFAIFFLSPSSPPCHITAPVVRTCIHSPAFQALSALLSPEEDSCTEIYSSTTQAMYVCLHLSAEFTARLGLPQSLISPHFRPLPSDYEACESANGKAQVCWVCCVLCEDILARAGGAWFVLILEYIHTANVAYRGGINTSDHCMWATLHMLDAFTYCMCTGTARLLLASVQRAAAVAEAASGTGVCFFVFVCFFFFSGERAKCMEKNAYTHTYICIYVYICIRTCISVLFPICSLLLPFLVRRVVEL